MKQRQLQLIYFAFSLLILLITIVWVAIKWPYVPSGKKCKSDSDCKAGEVCTKDKKCIKEGSSSDPGETNPSEDPSEDPGEPSKDPGETNPGEPGKQINVGLFFLGIAVFTVFGGFILYMYSTNRGPFKKRQNWEKLDTFYEKSQAREGSPEGPPPTF